MELTIPVGASSPSTVNRDGREPNWKIEGTRFLCASAHLRTDFARGVLKRMFRQDYRATATDFGVDVELLLLHCLDAHKRKRWRDGLVTILIAAAAACWLFGHGHAAYATAVVVLYLIACVVTLGEKRISRFRIVRKNFHSAVREIPRPSVRPTAREQKKIDKATAQQGGNVIVYSGFSPFVGSGISLGGWSFVVNLSRGKADFDGSRRPVQAFAEADLYATVRDDLHSLGLTGLSVEDLLCVSGTDVRGDERFLTHFASTPLTKASATVVAESIEHPTDRVRYYQCVRMRSWGGELMVSLFFRVRISGSNAFFEASYFLLPPIGAGYREVDALATPRFADHVSLVLAALIEPPFIAAGTCLRAAGTVLPWLANPIGKLNETAARRSDVIANPSYDYGADASLREIVATDRYYEKKAYRHYFQRLDKEMFHKVMERRLFDSLIDFLDAKNIDTSELAERSATILNNSVVVSGNAVLKAEAVSVGDQASATIRSFVGPGFAGPPRAGGKER